VVVPRARWVNRIVARGVYPSMTPITAEDVETL
jgi:hypothetical protein